MTSFTNTWNGSYEASPANSQDASLGATRIRELKVDIKERLAVDHSWVGDTLDGEHIRVLFKAPIADPTVAASKGGLYTKDVSSKAELFWKDEDANVLQITSAGALNPALARSAKKVLTGTGDVAVADVRKIIHLDVNSGDATFTLPDPSLLTDGDFYYLKRIDSDSDACTIDTDAGNIDGASSVTIDQQYDAILVHTDGSNYFITGAFNEGVPLSSFLRSDVNDTQSAGILTINGGLTINAGKLTHSGAFASTENEDGHLYIGDILLQWGTTANAANTTFPITFGAVYNVQLTPGTGVAQTAFGITSVSTTTLDVTMQNNVDYHWFAIGKRA